MTYNLRRTLIQAERKNAAIESKTTAKAYTGKYCAFDYTDRNYFLQHANAPRQVYS